MINGGFIAEIFPIGLQLQKRKVDCRKLETRLEQDCSKCHCIHYEKKFTKFMSFGIN